MLLSSYQIQQALSQQRYRLGAENTHWVFDLNIGTLSDHVRDCAYHAITLRMDVLLQCRPQEAHLELELAVERFTVPLQRIVDILPQLCPQLVEHEGLLLARLREVCACMRKCNPLRVLLRPSFRRPRIVTTRRGIDCKERSE